MRPQKYFLFLLSLFMATPAAAQTTTYLDILNHPVSSATERLSYGTDPNQFGDLWLPKKSGNHPVIILLHGGCWQSSLPGLELMSALAQNLSDDGFAVWNLEYRRLGHADGGYPGTFLDVANGIDYLRQIASPQHLDVSHIIIIGHSAGGHLGLWAAGRNYLPSTSQLFTPNPLPIDKVITLAGINDLQAYHDKGPAVCGGPQTINQLVGLANRARQNIYADTSPAQMSNIDTKQIIVSGVEDPIVPMQFGTDYAAQAQTRKQDVEIINIPNAGHFELIDPTSPAWAQIKRALITPLTK